MTDPLHHEIEAIKQRNVRVEIDKAWETSRMRRLIVAVLTYLVVTSFFLIAKLPHPFVNALVPTMGFMLSSLSLTFFKRLWLKYFYR